MSALSPPFKRGEPLLNVSSAFQTMHIPGPNIDHTVDVTDVGVQGVTLSFFLGLRLVGSNRWNRIWSFRDAADGVAMDGWSPEATMRHANVSVKQIDLHGVVWG